MPGGVTWTNRAQTTSIRRSQGFTVNWSGGSADSIIVIMGLGSDQVTKGTDFFYCLTSGGSGSFNVPPSALSNMPNTRVIGLQDSASAIAVVSIPLTGIASFTASGLDTGLVIPAVIDLRSVEVVP